MSVAPGSQEKHGYKSLLKIDLRRELDPPKFSEKPENVAFRGVSCMQMVPFRVAPVGEIEALALPEADSETSLVRRGSGRVQHADLRE